MNDENAKKIDDYIANNPNCKLPKTHSVIIKGESHDIQVYKLPLDLLFFNIKNGRFAAEYLELKEKIGRDLEPGNDEDKKVIQKMLLELDPKKSLELENDLRKYGQRDPGICTYDGNVHNGNRRMSVIQNIVDTGDLSFDFLQVARLPLGVTVQDLWLIEAGIQLSKNVQLDYGPINTLLKFKEGIDAGLTAIQVAKNLYGYENEKQILEKLEILKLITKYLKFIGEPNHFKKADRIVEHFIDLSKILATQKRSGASPDELLAYQNIGFQLIHDGVTQRELRSMKKIIAEEKSRIQLLKALEHSKPEPSEKKMERKIKADEDDANTPAVTIFNEANDTAKAVTDSSKPLTNLERAFTNLDTIDGRNSVVNGTEFQDLLKRVETIVNKLKK
tara:strand:+ start:4823 stop:5992 length:1170 start_codon:yes stop_codon:yes gene_type:complete